MKITLSKPESTILSAVRKYVEFLAPTYGPTGKKILIIDNEMSHKAVDDGRMSSQAFELKDEFENAVIQYIRETTEKTYQRVKDGTTTAALITAAIVENVFQNLDNEFINLDTHGIVLGLKKGLGEAVKKIEASGKKIKTQPELEAIALNSFNHPEIAKLVAETVFKIGKEGVIAIEDSQGMDTTMEVVQGLELSKGYVSPYLVNAPNNHVTLKSPLVLLVNKKIELFSELKAILMQVVEAKRQIIIVAEGFGENTLNTTIAQKFMSNGGFNPLLVEAPGFGDAKLDTLKDIGAITGAKVVDRILTLDKVTIADLGQAESVDSTKDKTVILGGKKADLKTYAESIKLPTTNKFEQEKIAKRVAQLLGGIAVIKVGAYTENEQKWLKAKIENAINATQLAFKDGVVQGGGLTFAGIKTSSDILNVALQAPRKQLELNGKEYLDKDAVDPTGVLIAGLETGVSIASGLITMGGISTQKRKYDDHGNPL